MKSYVLALCLLLAAPAAQADSFDVPAVAAAKRSVDSLAARLDPVRARYPQLSSQQIAAVVGDALAMSLNARPTIVDSGLDFTSSGASGTPSATATHGAGIVADSTPLLTLMIVTLTERHPSLSLEQIVAILKAVNP